MIDERLSPPVAARLEALERQAAWWRRATVCALFVLAIGGTMAFRRLTPGPLEATSLTLRAPRGAAVTLSLGTSGDLEAHFAGGADATLHGPRGNGLVLVNPEGREVVRIGEPFVRQVAP